MVVTGSYSRAVDQSFWCWSSESWQDTPSQTLSVLKLSFFMILFIDVLALRAFVAGRGLFFHCRRQGLLSGWGAGASRCSGVSCCRAQALGVRASAPLLGAQQLQSQGSGAQAR